MNLKASVQDYFNASKLRCDKDGGGGGGDRGSGTRQKFIGVLYPELRVGDGRRKVGSNRQRVDSVELRQSGNAELAQFVLPRLAFR